MKKFLQVLGLSVLLIIGSCATCIGVVWYSTSGAAMSADGFLALVGSGDMHGAYQATSEKLKGKEDEVAFAAHMKALELDQYKSASWSSRNLNNDQGEVVGSVTLKSGKIIPLRIKLERDRVWRVVEVSAPSNGSEI